MTIVTLKNPTSESASILPDAQKSSVNVFNLFERPDGSERFVR